MKSPSAEIGFITMEHPAFPSRMRPRQQAFAHEYIKHGVATRAYVAAGFSKKGAKQGAQRLLNQPPVRAYVSKLTEKADALAEQGAILTRTEALIALSQAFRDAASQLISIRLRTGGSWSRHDAALFGRCVRAMCQAVDSLARMQGWYEWRRPRLGRFGG